MKSIFYKLILANLIFCISLSVSGQSAYVIDTKELNEYALEAREPSPEIFVIYTNGDTLKGSSLKFKFDTKGVRERWVLDGVKLIKDSVKIVQDQYSYRQGIYARILRGSINLYVYQRDNPKFIFYGDGNPRVPPTTFYIGRGEEIMGVTFNSLKEKIQNCPSAVKQMNSEFENSIWSKSPNANLNDYRALIQILTIYNKNCKAQ